MTDLAVLAHDLTTFLTPFLPILLKKAGEAVVTETTKKAVGETWDATKALWTRMKSKVEEKPAVLEAAEDVAKNPTTPKFQTALEIQLEKLLTEDRSFATEIEQLFNKAKAVSGSQVTATHGGIAFGDNAQGNVVFTGGVGGDFVMGDKHNK